MKILCVYRYFWPDTAPYGKILRSMAERWIQDGYQVTVLTGQPGYNDTSQKKQPRRENLNGVNIIRVPLLPERKKLHGLRLLNFVIFLVKTLLHVFKGIRYNLIVINSYPPVFMGFTAYLISKMKDIPYIYHCQDIHPESSYFAGVLKNSLLFKILQKIDIENCREASLVVTLSEDMANTLTRRGLSRDNNNICVLNNFILDTYDESSFLHSQLIERAEDEFHLLFAGNIGNFQGLEGIIEAAKILKKNNKIKFNFIGDGLAKASLIVQAGDLLGKTVFFIPFQPLKIAFSVMETSNLAVISLKPNVYKVAYPSKTMMYLAAGCPLLAIIEKESVLACDIINKGIGYVCSYGDANDIAQTINRAWMDKEVLGNKRENIRSIAVELFDRDIILNEWSKIVNDLVKERYSIVT